VADIWLVQIRDIPQSPSRSPSAYNIYKTSVEFGAHRAWTKVANPLTGALTALIQLPKVQQCPVDTNSTRITDVLAAILHLEASSSGL
jgi:hypothetical protein